MSEPVLVKITLDDRKVEVIDGWVCLDGRPETREVIILEEHPNRAAILKLVPKATHMAGRLPLTLPEASVAQAALRKVHDPFDGTELAARERMRNAVWQKVFAEGAE